MYLIKIIEDINTTIDRKNREIIIANNKILLKLVSKDAEYFYKKGINIHLIRFEGVLK